jgi:hypothetical protein
VAVVLSGGDPDGDLLTFSVVTQPGHGTVSGSGASRTYTPDADYHGPDSFTYRSNDSTTDSATATVTITVTPVNDAPTADPKSVTTAEGTAVAVVLSGSDPDGDLLTFSVVTQPGHGTVSGSGASRTYTPNPNYHGPDSFTYGVDDGTVGSSAVTVTITVTPVNSPPSADSKSVTTAEDAAVAVVLSGGDPDGDLLTFSVVTQPGHGTVSGSGASRTYTPDADYHGPDSFTYRSNDSTTDSATATVTITVTPVNDAPTVSTAPTASGTEGSPVTITAGTTDVDADALTVAWTAAAGSDVDAGASCTIGAQVANTTISCSDNGTYVATVTVSDGHGGAATANTTITIANANPAVAITSAPSGPVQPGASLDLLASLSDPGANDTHTCTVNWGDGSSSSGVVNNRTCTASHAYATSGTKLAVITVADDDGGTGSASTTITVATVTPPPPPVSGCVRGELYWLLHSIPWTKSYNTAWDAVGGPSAKFFSSGLSWRLTLARLPFGSAYWILASEYIVATLNVASGASPSSEIKAALASAKAALAATTPKKGERDRNLVRIAEILERFNDGKAGPKRCGGDYPPQTPCRFLFRW